MTLDAGGNILFPSSKTSPKIHKITKSVRIIIYLVYCYMLNIPAEFHLASKCQS